MTPATVAILGAGELAHAHARVLVAHPDLRLAAIIEADAARGSALIEAVVHRYEGDRPRLFADLDGALAEVDMDIVAIGDPALHPIAEAAFAAGKTVVGGKSSRSDGRWYPFYASPSAERDGASDAAFAEHLRQYEFVLRAHGHGVAGAIA